MIKLAANIAACRSSKFHHYEVSAKLLTSEVFEVWNLTEFPLKG